MSAMEKLNTEVQAALDQALESSTPDLREIEDLILAGADISLLRSDVSPLMKAACDDNVALCSLLVRYGALVNQVNQHQETALMFASNDSSCKAMAYLIEQGANIDQVNSDGLTALLIACKCHHYVAALMLLEAGANPAITYNGRGIFSLLLTPNADSEKLVPLVQQLLEKGASPLPAVRHYFADSTSALICGFQEVIELFERYGYQVDREHIPPSALMVACKKRLVAGVKLLVSSGVPVNRLCEMPNSKNYTSPLGIAISTRNQKIIECLLEAGADPYFGGWSRWPLLELFYQPESELLGLFKQYGVVLDMIDEESQSTPFLWACAHAPLEVVQRMILYGTKLYQRDGEGLMGLHYAADADNAPVVRYLCQLLNPDCPVRSSDQYRHRKNMTPLMLAVQGGHVTSARLLLEAKANPYLSTLRYSSNLHCAAARGDKDMCDLLLNAGVPIDTSSIHNSSALSEAAGNNHPDLCSYLLSRGASTTPVSDPTVVFEAALRDDAANALEVLLTHDNDVFTRRFTVNDQTVSLFGLAVYHFKKRMCYYLLASQIALPEEPQEEGWALSSVFSTPRRSLAERRKTLYLFLLCCKRNSIPPDVWSLILSYCPPLCDDAAYILTPSIKQGRAYHPNLIPGLTTAIMRYSIAQLHPAIKKELSRYLLDTKRRNFIS